MSHSSIRNNIFVVIRNYFIIHFLTFFLFSGSAFTQTMLDKSFGYYGRVTTIVGKSASIGQAVVVQVDGKIIVAGYSSNQGLNYDFALTRYNTDGTLDSTFGNAGKVTTAIGTLADYGKSVVLQKDGKIIVAGYSSAGLNADFALVRYAANGQLDLSFGKEGKVITAVGNSNDYAKSIALQADGKIVVAGGSYNGLNYDFALVRYNENGLLDNTFGLNGKVTTDIGNSNDNGESVAIDADGKIVLTGYSCMDADKNIALARYNADGSPDISFNEDGKLTTDIEGAYNAGNSVALQSDGKILVAGYSFGFYNNGFALLRYNANGELDHTFGESGITTTRVGNENAIGKSVAVLADGKILVSGYTHNDADYDFALVKYNSNGTLDSTFNGNGTATTAIKNFNDYGNSMAIQADGKIIISGNSFDGVSENFSLARYISSDSNLLLGDVSQDLLQIEEPLLVE